MKQLLKIVSVFFFIAVASRASAQSIELHVILNSVMPLVNSSGEPHEESWWLVSPHGEIDSALGVIVNFDRPYCPVLSPQRIRHCDPMEYSQNVEVRANERDGKRLSPPFYLLKGSLDWQRSRRGRISGQFDLSKEMSRITLSLHGDHYLVTRTHSADKNRLTVTLRFGSIMQEIYTCETGGRTYPYCGDGGFEEVLWAGDLDGDGHLDFIAQFTDKYSKRRYYLYTSRNAETGQLVGLSAEYSLYTD